MMLGTALARPLAFLCGLVFALLALLGAGWGGYMYRGEKDAQRAAIEAREASVKAAGESAKRDRESLSERQVRLTKVSPTLDTLRGWHGGLRQDTTKGGQDAPETDETGLGCPADPWAGPEYLRVLGDAVRAGNEALGSAGDVRGAVQGDSRP